MNPYAIPKAKRNEAIFARFLAGERKAAIARMFGVSRQRVGELIAREQRKAALYDQEHGGK